MVCTIHFGQVRLWLSSITLAPTRKVPYKRREMTLKLVLYSADYLVRPHLGSRLVSVRLGWWSEISMKIIWRLSLPLSAVLWPVWVMADTLKDSSGLYAWDTLNAKSAISIIGSDALDSANFFIHQIFWHCVKDQHSLPIPDMNSNRLLRARIGGLSTVRRSKKIILMSLARARNCTQEQVELLRIQVCFGPPTQRPVTLFLLTSCQVGETW